MSECGMQFQKYLQADSSSTAVILMAPPCARYFYKSNPNGNHSRFKQDYLVHLQVMIFVPTEALSTASQIDYGSSDHTTTFPGMRPHYISAKLQGRNS